MHAAAEAPALDAGRAPDAIQVPGAIVRAELDAELSDDELEAVVGGLARVLPPHLPAQAAA